MSVSPIEVVQACSDALSFIIHNRHPCWSDFLTPAGESIDWVTGYIGYTLVDNNFEKGILHEDGQQILSHQREDGGWGYHSGVPSDADSTAFCALFLQNLEIGCDREIEKAIQFLVRHQLSSGGFSTYKHPSSIRRYMKAPLRTSFRGWCSPHTCVTSVVVQAIVREKKVISHAYDFIRTRQLESGLWRAFWWADDYYSTYNCAKVLSLTRIEEDRHMIDVACSAVAASQQESGSWKTSSINASCAFSTSLAVKLFFLSSNNKYKSNAEAGVRWLLDSQRQDGSWMGLPKLRVPNPDQVDPWNQLIWKINGGVGSIVRDQHHLFTTATVFSALNEYLRYVEH